MSVGRKYQRKSRQGPIRFLEGQNLFGRFNDLIIGASIEEEGGRKRQTRSGRKLRIKKEKGGEKAVEEIKENGEQKVEKSRRKWKLKRRRKHKMRKSRNLILYFNGF